MGVLAPWRKSSSSPVDGSSPHPPPTPCFCSPSPFAIAFLIPALSAGAILAGSSFRGAIGHDGDCVGRNRHSDRSRTWRAVRGSVPKPRCSRGTMTSCASRAALTIRGRPTCRPGIGEKERSGPECRVAVARPHIKTKRERPSGRHRPTSFRNRPSQRRGREDPWLKSFFPPACPRLARGGPGRSRAGPSPQKSSGALSTTSLMTKKVRVWRTPGSPSNCSPCRRLNSDMSRRRIFRK